MKSPLTSTPALPMELTGALPATDAILTDLATRAVLTGFYEENREEIDAAVAASRGA